MTRSLPVVVALACAAGCGEPARIGAIVSRSGAAAVYGEQVARGFDLAVDELNARGGVEGRKITLVYRDDSTNPEIGLAAVKELVERERVDTVLGAVSSTVTLRLAPYCERRHVLLISPSASAPQISEAGEFVFRTFPSDVLEGASMAEFARDLGLDRAAVLSVDNDYGVSLSRVFDERFRASGGSVVASASFTEGDPASIGAAVRAVAPAAPRGIYIPAYATDLAAALAALRGAGVRAILLGTSATTPDLIRSAGPAAENLVFPMPSFDPASDDPSVRSFVTAFRARFGDDPDVYAAHAYDTVRVLAAAAERAGSWDADELRAALLKIDNYDGATGRMAFDPKGDVVQYPRLYVVRGGQVVAYDRFVESGGALPVPGR